MPVFSYTARDANGQLLTDTAEAVDAAALRRELRENGLYLISSAEQVERETLSDRFASLQGVKLGDLLIFSQQLATMVGAGLPILEALHELTDEAENRTLRRALQQITRDVQAGSTFSQALSRHPKVFSNLFVSLVYAGETGGVLEQTLETIAQNLDKEQELREKVKSAFVYPAVVLVAAGGVVTFMLLYIIPIFERVYGQFQAQLPGPTRILIAVSNLMTHYWWLGLLGIIALVIAFRTLLRTNAGRRIWDRAKLRMPILGKLIRQIVVVRFVRTLGIMLGAGVPLLSALRASAGVAANSEFTAAVTEVASEVAEGASLSSRLRASGKFPNLVPRLVQVGEESGTLDAMLLKIAYFFDREIDYTVRRLTMLMEPALTLVLGGLVGGVVVSLYMPIFTLASVIRR